MAVIIICEKEVDVICILCTWIMNISILHWEIINGSAGKEDYSFESRASLLGRRGYVYMVLARAPSIVVDHRQLYYHEQHPTAAPLATFISNSNAITFHTIQFNSIFSFCCWRQSKLISLNNFVSNNIRISSVREFSVKNYLNEYF